jgi:hypothetical protein
MPVAARIWLVLYGRQLGEVEVVELALETRVAVKRDSRQRKRKAKSG